MWYSILLRLKGNTLLLLYYFHINFTVFCNLSKIVCIYKESVLMYIQITKFYLLKIFVFDFDAKK